MKSSSWALAGVGAAGAVGLTYLLAGWFQPGKSIFAENFSGAGKPLLAEAKKKMESFRQEKEKIATLSEEFLGIAGQEGEHRVFVSNPLVFLPENPEPVQVLDWKMKTSDGLEIGWKMKYGFDPADPVVFEQDPDGDGFSNSEEFDAATDPLDRESTPPKERKLRVKAGEALPMLVTCPEKSGGFFTIRFQAGKKRAEFRGRPGESFWLIASPDILEVFLREDDWKQARTKAKEKGQGGHGIPLKFVSYEEKIQKIKDATTGGVEIEVDNSEVSIQRDDALSGIFRLRFSGALRSAPLVWDVGQIVFSAPGNDGDIGPVRIGEVFSYAGREFAVLDRKDGKVQLRDIQSGEAKTFWVIRDSSVSAGVP